MRKPGFTELGDRTIKCVVLKLNKNKVLWKR